MSTILNYLPFIIILCAMVTIHEFGHFIVAKILGIPAEVFSVGFGPRLFGFNWGGTDFRLSAIPLGGYVKFRGENLEMIQGKSEGSVEEFLSHPKWKRFLVALAGPAFNIFTAILIPMAAIMIGFQESAQNSQPIIIGNVVKDSPAEKAGLQPMDRIVVSNGVKDPAFNDFKLDVTLRADEDIPMTIDRNGQLINVVVRPKADGQGQGARIGIEPYLKNILVSSVKPDSAAAQAGVQPQDRITTINGQPIMTWSKTFDIVKEGKGKDTTLGLERGSQTVIATVKVSDPVKSDLFGIGAELQQETVFIRKTGIGAALGFALDYNWRILKITGVAFKQIIVGRLSARDSLSGPIGMAKMTADAFESGGWAETIQLMGLLSLNLGIMNLLPIPVLDGGMILLLIVEALLGLVGLSLTMKVRERFQQVGFVALMLLMGFVIFNDIARLLPFGKSNNQTPAAQSSPAPQPSK
ncbi:MAG: RIP metalloprotease RseP [Acidobacteria bacterium]|nr:RIP metalloprotease RseP [Acidobacteriota bacterium]